MDGEHREQFIYGSGCNRCAQTGYRGRTGVFEILTMTDALRQLFLAEAPRHQLWKQALTDGMVSLRRDAMLKVKQGITTPYEVMRVLFTLE
jgi:general secretion pathway protein E